jgi:hypothetical protein
MIREGSTIILYNFARHIFATTGCSRPSLPMKPDISPRGLTDFVLHLVVYGSLLLLYFVLVLQFMAGWLLHLFQQHRVDYAFMAIVLMIGQAVGLEIISHFLLKLIHRKKG